MAFTEGIFNRATIKAVSDYLLYGVPDEEESRILFDYANELVSEATDVYTEIGVQAGFLIMIDMIKSTNLLERMIRDEPQKVNYQDIYDFLFREVSLNLKFL